MDVPDNDAVHAINSLTDKINQLVTKLDSLPNNSTTQTVTSNNMGPLLSAALATMFCTIFMVVCIMVWLVPEIHDLRAWRDIHQNHISALEAKEKAK